MSLLSAQQLKASSHRLTLSGLETVSFGIESYEDNLEIQSYEDNLEIESGEGNLEIESGEEELESGEDGTAEDSEREGGLFEEGGTGGEPVQPVEQAEGGGGGGGGGGGALH